MNLRDHRLLTLGVAIVLGALLLPPSLSAADKPLRLYGAGATFPAPLFLSWLHAFNRLHPDIQPGYQPLNSSGGITDLEAGRVDFAGADYRLPEERASKIRGGIVQLPMAAAGIALIYNLPGIDSLRLSRKAVLGIFSGTISRWNDPVITETNPALNLPDLPITFVARMSGAGTSFNLTRHLSMISPEFRKTVGATVTPNWPAAIKERGVLLRGRGNDGVSSLVKGVQGAIGYVAYPHSDLARIPAAAIENKAGKIVAPNQASFAASMQAIGEKLSLDTLINPPGEASYPMVAVSWMLVPNDLDDPAKQKAMVEIIDYALGPGQEIAERIGYIPFPPAIIDFVRKGVGALRQP